MDIVDIRYIKQNFKKWNRKDPINYNNRIYKVIGCGKDAFKVIKFEPQEELGGKPGWSQVFWPYDQIKNKDTSATVLKKLELKLKGQTTLNTF